MGTSATDYTTVSWLGMGIYSIPVTTKNPDIVAKIMGELLSYYDNTKSMYFDRSIFEIDLSDDEKYIKNVSQEKIYFSPLLPSQELNVITAELFEKIINKQMPINEVLENDSLKKQIENMIQKELSLN